MFSKLIDNKTILVTGGTGSFGHVVVDRLLKYNPKRIIIFDRDEKAQFDMGNKYNNEKLRFIIGDIREKDSISHAMYGVDFVLHAAALKQIPSGEFFPLEVLRINTFGSYNVIEAAIENGVEKIVVLSTDKAVYPINVYGMTKALMERIMIGISRERRRKTVLCGTRYGNVMYTRGSVIPYFVDLMKAGKPLTVTDKRMTRFMMHINESVDLTLTALKNGQNGEIYIKKAPAAVIGDLAEALISLFKYNKGIEEIGIRPGEKMHECLISREEIFRTEDCGDYYKIVPEVPNIDYRQYYFRGQKDNFLPEAGYTSENTRRLSTEEIKKLLLSVNEIQEELKSFKTR